MATVKTIDIFGQLNGLDFHLALEPNAGESGLEALLKSVNYLVKNGATARPVPGRGTGGRQVQPIPDKCPVCAGEIACRSWTKKETGQAFDIYQCSDNQGHFKPVYRLAK